MSTNIDLFEHYETLPQEVQNLISTITDEFDYKDCENMVLSLNKLGYTCEYGLSAELYNLQKIETTNETPEEMNTTENVVFEKENKQIIKKGNHFFTRTFTENGECFESADFNTLERAKESLSIVPTIEETNILIAEFLQIDKNENGTFELPQYGKVTLSGEFKTEFNASELKFNSDWNWLIEVVEKIENLLYKDNNDVFKVVIDYGMCIIYNMINDLEVIVNVSKSTKIEAVYQAVIQFIEWYNSQPK